jgi:hypothetical protein
MTAGHRPVEDACSALVCGGVFTRFSELRVSIVEGGGDWVAPWLEHLADTYKKMLHGFDENPVEAFKRNMWISPFHEDNFEKLVGADDGRNLANIMKVDVSA